MVERGPGEIVQGQSLLCGERPVWATFDPAKDEEKFTKQKQPKWTLLEEWQKLSGEDDNQNIMA